MTKKSAIISDIDGTISDRRHRLHYLEEKKDWETFFSKMVFDPPIKSVINKILKYINKGNCLILVTGRPEKYRKITISWLKEHTSFDNYLLLMRADNDYRKDIEIKADMLYSILKDHKVLHVFEDNEELSCLWRNNGLDVTLI